MNNQDKAKLSVIVPIYNVEHYLEKTVTSLLNQDYPNYEIILVDDGSNDNSSRICDGFAKMDRIRTFHQQNAGVSAARNAGLDVAEGAYIVFVDGDDYVDSHYLTSLFNWLDKTHADMVIEGYENVIPTESYRFPNRKFEDETGTFCYTGQEFILNHIGKAKDTSCCAKIFKKNRIDNEKIRFNTQISNLEDTLFLYQYAFLCEKIVFVNAIHYFRTVRPDGVVFSPFSISKLSALRVFDSIDIFLRKKDAPKVFFESNDWLRFHNLCYFMTELLRSGNREIFDELKKQARIVWKRRGVYIGWKSMIKYFSLFYIPSLYIKLWQYKNGKRNGNQ